MGSVPKRFDWCLLDKEAGNHVSATVFQLPGKYGKGILVSPTIHGNLLVGPTAVDQEDKDGTYTTAEGLAEACEKATKSVNNIPFRQVITSFSIERQIKYSEHIGFVVDLLKK